MPHGNPLRAVAARDLNLQERANDRTPRMYQTPRGGQ